MTNFETLLAGAPQVVKDIMESLKGLRENPLYHPEESTFEHVRIVVERLEVTGDVDLIVSGFFHDLFKLKTAIVHKKTGHPSSPFHDAEVAAFIRHEKAVQDFITAQGANVEVVAFICEQHMRIKIIGEMKASKRWAIMSNQLFDKLCLFSLADKMSNNWTECFAAWGDEKAKEALMIGDVTIGWLRAQEEERLAHERVGFKKEHRLTGADLIAMGYPQGRIIGQCIKITDENLGDMPIDEVFDMFKKLISAPQDFVNDSLMSMVVDSLISMDAIV